MTRFEQITKDPDTLAAALYGMLSEHETNVVDKIRVATGIEVEIYSLAPEIRIATMKEELLKELDEDEVT